MNSKQKVAKYLNEETFGLTNNDFSSLTTTVIAKTLYISRSLTSQYLNELFSEGSLIKVSSRPVYYFDKKALESIYNINNLDEEYLSLKELFGVIDKSCSTNPFEKMIGYDGSLSTLIQQVISAIEYPDRGLPIVICGKSGSGKNYLVKTLYKYCIKNQIINKESQLKHILVHSFIDIEKELFGDDKNEGILENKNVGVLYLENPSLISKIVQIKLAEVIRNGFYKKRDKIVKTKVRFVLGSNDDNLDNIEYSLLQSLPIICKVPSLDQRSMKEKELFIINFFKEQQSKLGYKIHISYKLLEALQELKFDQDINELRRVCTRICARALANHDKTSIYCRFYHLPDDKLKFINLEGNDDNHGMIEIDNYNSNERSDKVTVLFGNILDHYKSYQTNQLSYEEMLSTSYEAMRDYYDLLIFDTSYEHSQIGGLQKIIDEILEDVRIKNKVNIPTNCSFVLARMLITSTYLIGRLGKWISSNHKEVSMFLQLLKEEMYDAYMLTQEIVQRIQANTELKLSDTDLIFIILNIYFYNDEIERKDTAALIISHGYSTASSIADAANHLLKDHVFDAFDMPLSSSVEEIIRKVNDYIDMYPYYKNLILLVDMGSLELIGDKVISNINIGVINNISTAIALQIGSMISKDYQLENILEKAAEDAKVKYKILNRAEKDKAILFVSEAGKSVADKMVSLFKNSLPKSIDLRFISCDFQLLLANGLKETAFSKFDVLLMIKPESLTLKSVTSVSLEDMISFKDIEVVNKALANYLNKVEIEQFNHNLLKTFSLQNVIQNLTILNPTKLLDFVSESTSKLERKLNKKFKSKTTIGIYMHVCFLIERLVTKTAIVSYADVERFKKNHQDFIADVNICFEEMLKHYNVQLPLSEIVLLYDYIVHDIQKERKGSCLFEN
ncbi:MAG: PRD domain-containing protein [Anaerorhabdus sp.]